MTENGERENFVTIDNVKNYLNFLREERKLFDTIHKLSATQTLRDGEHTNLHIWRYLVVAENRYYTFLKMIAEEMSVNDLKFTNVKKFVPPLDVQIFWYAHLLNPIKYLEDCYYLFGKFISFEIVNFVEDPESLEYTKQKWTKFTNGTQPYDLDINKICTQNAVQLEFPYLNGAKFLQDSIVDVRMHCNLKTSLQPRARTGLQAYNADQLSLIQFKTEFRKRCPFTLNQDFPKLYTQASTPLRTHAVFDPVNGEIIYEKLSEMDIEYLRVIKQLLNDNSCVSWNQLLTGVKKAINYKYGYKKTAAFRTFAKLIGSYRNNITPFGLDLIKSVLRQYEFATEIGQHNWYDDSIIRASIKRYSNFLSLSKQFSTTLIVPTLDIDLVWHSHQIQNQRYFNFTRQFISVLHHNDNVDGRALRLAFVRTAILWKNTFNEPYSSISVFNKWMTNVLLPPFGLFLLYKEFKFKALGISERQCGVFIESKANRKLGFSEASIEIDEQELNS